MDSPSGLFDLGVAMGFGRPLINSMCRDIPQAAGKLLVLVLENVDELDAEESKDCLLNACRWIPSPVYGAVMDELESEEASRDSWNAEQQ